ncbi:hypothetical protein HYALB_00013018 [Hymenoscyphus albidus]|uniref:Rhodopsin domain-containing protein n=1 Tax=Hymenoscyphus albidus TaxID=595503 RepID=A0A9N9Q3B1_9HELO|nr:hypothetical protein HYALB_00013018 [Hymenoscyphus albidus]
MAMNVTDVDIEDRTESYAYRKTIIMAVDVGLVSLASVIVLLRFYTRVFISRYFGQDDWWMLLSWILALGNLAIWVLYLDLGSWKRRQDIILDDLRPLFLILWLIQWSLSFVHGTMNISVLTFYLRVFQDQSLRFRRLIHASIFFTTAASIIVIFIIIFQCVPTDAYWNGAQIFGNPKCLNNDYLLFTQSGLILLCDVVLFILPMKYIWQLNIPKWQRIQVMVLVGLGGFTCIASICRVVALHKLANSRDRTYDGLDYSLWTSIELFVALITTCLPPCRPLFLKYCCTGRGRTWEYTWTRTTTPDNIEPASGTHLSKDATPSSSRRRLSSRSRGATTIDGEEMGPMGGMGPMGTMGAMGAMGGATVRIGAMGRIERVYSYQSSTRGSEHEGIGPMGRGG